VRAREFLLLYRRGGFLDVRLGDALRERRRGERVLARDQRRVGRGFVRGRVRARLRGRAVRHFVLPFFIVWCLRNHCQFTARRPGGKTIPSGLSERVLGEGRSFCSTWNIMWNMVPVHEVGVRAAW
jgi:hypothetical protein